jgi:hypothetical protein
MKTPSAALFAVIALACACLATPAAAFADRGACLAAAHANDSAKSYRAAMTTSFRGQTTTSTVDLVLPDRFHVTEPTIEMIAIGKRAWKRTPGGAWQSMPGMEAGDLSAGQVKVSNLAGSCVDAGMGMWHGQAAHLFRGTNVRGGKRTVATIYVFADGFVHHLDLQSSDGTIEMDLSNFNTTTVNAPT